MNTEQREEIESICRGIELGVSHNEARGSNDMTLIPGTILPLVQFARQQLNLRVDGEKLREEIWKRFTANIRQKHRKELEALVLECLVTDKE